MTKNFPASASVVGLGKLGLCLAAVLASKGFQVVGVELDGAKVESVNSGRSPIYEPGLDQLIQKNHKRLKASTEYGPAISQSDVTFVVVPTPSDVSGAFSLRFVEQAMERVGRQLKRKDGYHLVVLVSTVMPGSMDNSVKPILEKASGKACGKDFGLCYSPEFIALGDVIRGLLRPDFILIGESDQKAGRLLASIQRRICSNSPPVERMEFVNAEIAKISVNSYVTMKMSFANTLAEIAEKTPGGNVDKISAAIGRDRRIGTAYLKGALGYGGPCFPRDNVAFAKYAASIGAQASLAETTHAVNLRQPDRIIGIVEQRGFRKGSRVGILGLSYKPNTNIVEQSQSMTLAQRLSAAGYRVTVFDPAAMDNARSVLGSSVEYAASAKDCVRGSDFVILATPWEEFSRMGGGAFRGKVVIDCWRHLGPGVRQVSTYVPVGSG